MDVTINKNKETKQNKGDAEDTKVLSHDWIEFVFVYVIDEKVQAIYSTKSACDCGPCMRVIAITNSK